jgi:hypothetical protein
MEAKDLDAFVDLAGDLREVLVHDGQPFAFARMLTKGIRYSRYGCVVNGMTRPIRLRSSRQLPRCGFGPDPQPRSVPELGPTHRRWEPRQWVRLAPPWLFPLPPFKYSSRPSRAGSVDVSKM